MNTRQYRDFTIKRGTKDDEARIMRLFVDMPPTGFFAGCSRKFWRIFLRHLLEHPLGIMVVAFDQNCRRCAGYSVAIGHPHKFWSDFIMAYPLSAGAIILRKKYKLLIKHLLLNLGFTKKKSSDSSKDWPSEDAPEFTWLSSTSRIARIMFIGVLPDFRRLGLGQALYSFLAEELTREDYGIIEAHIDKGNKASVALHRKSGWELQELRQGDHKAILNLKCIHRER